jgi:GT2 family glycosyltransferase
MDVSIILVSYNTKDLTRNCLNSIYEKVNDLNFDVWVVDNNSQDGSAGMIKEEFPQVKLIENKENLGFGRANNIAIKASNAKYCFLLNTDTVLVNNAVKILFDFMENNVNAGACGGSLFDENMQYATSFGLSYNRETLLIRHTPVKFIFPKKNKKIKNYVKSIERTKTQEISYISGADLMLRKSILEKTGLFNERFFLYYEETELQHRIKKAGYDIYYVSDAKIIHFEGKSSASSPKAALYSLKSQELYYELCYGKFWAFIVKILFLTKYLKLKLKSFVSVF